MDCPLCHIDAGEQQIVFENEYCRFLQQPQPVLTGSGIIIPVAHRVTVFELTPDEWTASWQLLQQVKEWLDEKLRPDGYNIGWNAGSTAGQEIFHAHMHVIPRFDDEPYAGRGIRYWIKQDANRRGR